MTQAPRAMRVVFWGTSDTGKPRVRILLDGLRANGVEVIECRADVWGGIEDKSQVRGFARWLGLLSRIALAYPVLAWRYLRLPRHDWVLLGYPALVDVLVIRLLATFRRTPVAMDWFLSAYDTIVLDRALVGRDSVVARAIHLLEKLAVRLPERVFMDTATHARRMEQVFALEAGRCGHAWVGVETDAFPASPGPSRPPAGDPPQRPTRVLFYGQFIPLHGIETIIGAARLLREHPVDWSIVGRGQQGPSIRAMLSDVPLPRLDWRDWVAYEALVEEIAASDICLGIFGTSDKAASVIPNKAFQVLAAGKPLLTRDSAAMRELVGTGMTDVRLVPAGDPAALAAAVLAWHRAPPAADPRRREVVDAVRPAAVAGQLLVFLGREHRQQVD